MHEKENTSHFYPTSTKIASPQLRFVRLGFSPSEEKGKSSQLVSKQLNWNQYARMTFLISIKQLLDLTIEGVVAECNSYNFKPARISEQVKQSTHLYQSHCAARKQSVYCSQCRVRGYFLLSVESRLEAFSDEREARSRRGSMPRNRAQKRKLSTKTQGGCWSDASSFPFQQRSRKINVVIRVL